MLVVNIVQTADAIKEDMKLTDREWTCPHCDFHHDCDVNAARNLRFCGLWLYDYPITGEHPYIFVVGIYLKRSWGGEMTSVSVLVAIGVSEDGYREILGACEGASESKECWRSFLVSLKERGLNGVRLFTSDKHLGFLESASEVFPDARWQRCTVHFFRNLMTKIPRNKLSVVMPLLKATYAQEDKEATLKKAVDVEQKLRALGLKSAADLYAKGVAETLTYLDFPHEQWRSIRINNILEHLNREIRRRTRVVGCFPDGASDLMLVCARLRYVASKDWGTKQFMSMKHLYELEIQRKIEKELKSQKEPSIKSNIGTNYFAKNLTIHSVSYPSIYL